RQICNTFAALFIYHCLLFLCLHAPLLALHSFPTRRSSDLDLRRRVEGPPRPVADHVRDGQLRRRRGVGQGDRRHRWRSHAAEDQDRKSTRLNSSHLGISYAVFCLKKKKPTHTCVTWLTPPR